jgi:uncharacterized protein YeeX (DUF496 family)
MERYEKVYELRRQIAQAKRKIDETEHNVDLFHKLGLFIKAINTWESIRTIQAHYQSIITDLEQQIEKEIEKEIDNS